MDWLNKTGTSKVGAIPFYMKLFSHCYVAKLLVEHCENYRRNHRKLFKNDMEPSKIVQFRLFILFRGTLRYISNFFLKTYVIKYVIVLSLNSFNFHTYQNIQSLLKTLEVGENTTGLVPKSIFWRIMLGS